MGLAVTEKELIFLGSGRQVAAAMVAGGSAPSPKPAMKPNSRMKSFRKVHSSEEILKARIGSH
jgi:hypothetical protein